MLETEYPELAPLTKGSSFNKIVTTLYYAHLLRYTTQSHLKDVYKYGFQVATKPNLKILVELGYVRIQENIYTTTQKTLDLLINFGYKNELLPRTATGYGEEIYNTDSLVKLIKDCPGCHILYPEFGYIKPDALQVLVDGQRYQLRFIEVEAKKPELFWQAHLEDKREKYNRLAQDELVFKYWGLIAPHLGLRCPRIEDFCFSVLCVADGLNYDWEGWEFEI